MDENKVAVDYKKYIDIVQKVITAPVSFYRDMAKSGGLVEPLIFAIVMGVVAGLIQAVLAIVGIGMAVSFLTALASIVLVPIFVAIFGFIGAGILFVIWKLMGSQESFEVSFRCLAYAAAITPITAFLNAIPYIGPIIGLLWMTYLLVNASTEVHQIQPKLAWIVFGFICAVFALGSISSQMAARKMTTELDEFKRQTEQLEQMNPEDAGKAVGEFLKGMQKATE
ncbi:MAG: YIP1 family protein [Syntrophobacteraceae bacterium]